MQGFGCRGSKAGSYLWLIVFVHHSTLGLRVIKKKVSGAGFTVAAWRRQPTPPAPLSLPVTKIVTIIVTKIFT